MSRCRQPPQSSSMEPEAEGGDDWNGWLRREIGFVMRACGMIDTAE
jgi:hypothetical protein